MRLAVLIALCLAATGLPARAQIPFGERQGDRQYQATVGQPGRDVIWVPTPPALATAMLRAAQVEPTDIVFDLGSGDGRLPIAAAKEFGAVAYGVEFNPDLVALARRNAERAGVGRRVTFIQGDIFKQDFSKATVLTLYLLPSINLRLRDRILAMRPGTRVVSHAFDMGEWVPDEEIVADSRIAYLWIVPARVGGRWVLERGRSAEPLILQQEFQMLEGTLGGAPLKGGRLRGDAVNLVLPDGSGLTGAMGPGVMIGEGWSARRAE